MDLAIKIIPFRNVFVFDWLHYFVYLLFIDYFLAFAPNQKNLYAWRKPSYLTQVATTMKNHILEGWEWRVFARKIRKKLWRRTIKKPALPQKLKPVEIDSLSVYQLYITKAIEYEPICIFPILCIVLIKNKPWSSSERLLKQMTRNFLKGFPYPWFYHWWSVKFQWSCPSWKMWPVVLAKQTPLFMGCNRSLNVSII